MNGAEVAAPPSAQYGYYRSKKRPYYYILESESSQESDDGSDTALSIQGKETDLAKDTSDTDWSSADEHGSVIEYDVVSSNEDGTEHVASQVIGGESSSDADENVVMQIAVLSDIDVISADSEDSLTTTTDCELNPIGYLKCAQCQNANNNPMFRYCKRCYQFRKELFPPRPRRKRPKSIQKKRGVLKNGTFSKKEVKNDIPLYSSPPALDFQSIIVPPLKNETASSAEKLKDPSAYNVAKELIRKRPMESETEFSPKKMKEDVCDKSVIKKLQNDKYISQNLVAPLGSVHDVTSFSQPIFSSDQLDTLSVKSGSSSDSDMCIICLAEPKTGVFVHGRIAHICCCYKCSVKVWTKTKRCPICQCKVSNVLKAFIK